MKHLHWYYYPFENEEYDYLSDTKERLFLKNETVFFPIHEAYEPGYYIELNEALTEEMSVLLFVYTKKPVPWIDQHISLESVRSWIYKIPMNEREVVYRNVTAKTCRLICEFDKNDKIFPHFFSLVDFRLYIRSKL